MQTVTMQEYTHTGPIDCNKPINVENLTGKTAIVTGGASYWNIELNTEIRSVH